MRDIDFEELDKAVNNFLDGRKVEDALKTEVEISKPEPRPMVFSRRNVVDAGSFHGASATKTRDDVVENTSKDEKNSKEEVSKNDALKVEIPDFVKNLAEDDDKVLREIGDRNDRTKDFLADKIKAESAEKSSEEKVDFSEQIHLENAEKYAKKRDSFVEKMAQNNTVFEAPILEEVEVSKEEILRKEDDSREGEKAEISNEVSNEKSKDFHFERVRGGVVVPSRSGVYKIEDDVEVTTFSGEKPFEKNEEKEESAAENDEKIDVFVKKSEKIEKTEEVEKTEALGEPQKEEKDDSNERISVNIGERSTFAREARIERAPARISVEEKNDQTVAVPQISEEKKDDSLKFDDIVSTLDQEKGVSKEEKIITQPISEASKISSEEAESLKTPFVQNPKIDKRPLGAGVQQAMATSFEIRKGYVEKRQKIREAKQQNPAPTVPLMASDEYVAAPVVSKKKKKSGWVSVVVTLLIMALISVGVGFAVYYFTLNS